MELSERRVDISIHGQKLFLPFNNLWNQNVYYTDQSFSLSPTFIRTNSTSGSPVVLGDDFFLGCLNPHADALWTSDGKTLSCTASEKQSFYYAEGDPFQIWQEYNVYVSKSLSRGKNTEVPSLPLIEYCTWVEQKKFAINNNISNPIDAMGDIFINDYLKRIDKMDLPRGVLTLDHGWAINSENFNFEQSRPDKNKFNDFSFTIKRIENSGFIPGLWFAPAFLYPECQLFNQYSELRGERFTGANEGGFNFPLYYLNVTDQTADIIYNWFKELFAPYIEMGVRKLKIDFTYNNKSKMIKILELLYKAVKDINQTVEVEGHIPDIFAAQYQDAVRLNDLVVETNTEWEQLFEDHYKVCLNSAYGTQLNLDHVGTNSPNISEADFLKSLAQFKGKNGYPVISMLPDNFSENTVNHVRQYLQEYRAVNHPT